MKKGFFPGLMMVIVAATFFLAEVSAMAAEVKKSGRFTISGDTLIVNNKERFKMDRHTVIVNKGGRKFKADQVKLGRVVLIETDGGNYARKITILDWYD